MSSFQNPAIVISIGDLVIHYSARKYIYKFPIKVNSTMGDTYMYISCPSLSKNDRQLADCYSRLQNPICRSYDHKIDTQTHFAVLNKPWLNKYYFSFKK